MLLPRRVSEWDREWLYRYQEREAIMLDSGVKDARRKAEDDTRRYALTEPNEFSDWHEPHPNATPGNASSRSKGGRLRERPV